jgi:glucose-1-phosphate thymidylyltransferase
MKALVLSGGSGTRLRPFSYSMPKQLVPIANRPVLFHCLESVRDAGITDVGVIVGTQGLDAVRAAVGDGSAFGLQVTYIVQEKPLGLAHCVEVARDFLGEDDFCMHLGETVMVGGIGSMARDFEDNGRPDAQIVVSRVAEPSEYGVAEIDRAGHVRRVEEKPEVPRSDLAMTGVYFSTPAIHEAVRSIEPGRRGELEITDAIQWLVEHGTGGVRASVFTGYWKDAVRIDDFLECNKVILESLRHAVLGTVDDHSRIEGPVLIEQGAHVTRSHIVGPAIVGAGTVIEDSYVGPYTSIGSSCALYGAGMEFSIVLDGVSVGHVHGIHGSAIGRSAEVRLADREFARHRLVIGDYTQVEVVA